MALFFIVRRRTKKGVKMQVIFNDSRELQIQSAEITPDGALRIRTISATEDELKRLFEDTFATQRLVIKEREEVIGEYEKYTRFDAIVKYTAGILGVLLYKEGETPEEILAKLQADNAELKAQNEMLTACMLEMSELVYQ